MEIEHNTYEQVHNVETVIEFNLLMFLLQKYQIHTYTDLHILKKKYFSRNK